MSSASQIIESFASSNQNDNTAIDSTVSSLTANLQSAPDDKDFEARLWSLAKAIVDTTLNAATPTPTQDNIIELLKRLRSAAASRIGSKFEIYSADVDWSEVPLLGAAVRESWTPKNKTAKQWANLNALVAKLTASGVHDFGLYGIWSFRDALESDELSPELGLAGVLMWLEHAGSNIIGWVREQRDFAPDVENKPNPAWLGKLAKDAGVERNGYSIERWRFWKRRLQDILGCTGTGTETSNLASKGLQKMESLEKDLENNQL